MRKIEGQLKAVVDELGYLKQREERFSQTNSEFMPPFEAFGPEGWIVSTNERVQNFAWFIIILLGLSGAYQILHLRTFFKKKYLID